MSSNTANNVFKSSKSQMNKHINKNVKENFKQNVHFARLKLIANSSWKNICLLTDALTIRVDFYVFI